MKTLYLYNYENALCKCNSRHYQRCLKSWCCNQTVVFSTASLSLYSCLNPLSSWCPHSFLIISHPQYFSAVMFSSNVLCTMLLIYSHYIILTRLSNQYPPSSIPIISSFLVAFLCINTVWTSSQSSFCFLLQNNGLQWKTFFFQGLPYSSVYTPTCQYLYFCAYEVGS